MTEPVQVERVGLAGGHVERSDQEHRGFVLFQLTLKERSGSHPLRTGISRSTSVSSAISTGLVPHSSRNLLTTPFYTVTVLKVDSSFVDWIASTIANLRTFFSDCFETFNQTSLPIETVYLISVVALAVQLFHRDCLIPLLTQSQDLSLSWLESAEILFVLPVLTTIISIAISVTLLLQWHPVEAVVVGGLIALLVVECLVPFAVAACTGMLFVKAISWGSALVLLATVWVTSTISSRCIRLALYPSLGHG